MPNDEAYKPRLSIELTKKQFDELQQLIPWGQKKKIFGPIVDDIIRLSRRHGHVFIAALIARSIKLEDFIPLPKEVEHGDTE